MGPRLAHQSVRSVAGLARYRAGDAALIIG